MFPTDSPPHYSFALPQNRFCSIQLLFSHPFIPILVKAILMPKRIESN